MMDFGEFSISERLLYRRRWGRRVKLDPYIKCRAPVWFRGPKRSYHERGAQGLCGKELRREILLALKTAQVSN